MNAQPPDIPAAPPAPLQRLSDDRVLAHAPAKLNLTLQVGPPGPDGYHPLDSLVVKITLYDRLLLSARPDATLSLHCDDPSAGAVEQNLVLRAAQALQERAPGPAGADIVLRKRIPVGAGLGGGSSDAAAALRALDQLWGLQLPVEELAQIGLTLGSDVPLFIGPQAARMTGRGQHLTGVRLPPLAALVYATPASCPTGPVYREYDRLGPRQIAPLDLAAMQCLAPSQWGAWLRNDLYEPARRLCPAIEEHRALLADALGRAVHMTGSGSALFVLCDSPYEARSLLASLPAALRVRTHAVENCPW